MSDGGDGRASPDPSASDELAYYRRRLDELAGESVRLDYEISGLRKEVKKRRQAFTLLSRLQDSVASEEERSRIFDVVLGEVNATLGMDGTVVLVPSTREGMFRADQWLGFSEEGSIDDFGARVARLEIEWPPAGVDIREPLLVNKHSSRTPFIDLVHDNLGLPYFVCVPVVVEDAIAALLVSGRVKEAGRVYPPLDRGDVETFKAISSLVSRFIELRRIGVLKETDRLKTRLFANVSHELRTPITLTLGPLDGILGGRYGEVSESVRAQCSMMWRNQQRLLGLVQQLLDVARLEAGRMPLRATPLPRPNSFVRDLVEPFRAAAERRGLSCDVVLDPRLNEREDVWVDREKVHELLANLLSNALKFTSEGGVVVTTELVDGRMRLAVADTGVGIHPDDLGHVFDRFRQGERGVSREIAGTGLGLAWVKEIAELHGGGVTARSELGRGTTFTVEVPLGREHLDPASVVEFEVEDLPTMGEGFRAYILPGVDGEESDVEELNARTAASLDPLKGTVLYVEDNADLRRYLRDVLLPDYNVYLARDGREGLEMARRYVPDLLIVDQMMPRMGGGELLAEIRDDPELARTPVIVLTARVGTDARVESLEAGADDYLTKPFDVAELKARARNLLRLRAQESELRLTNQVLEARIEDQLAALARKGGPRSLVSRAVADHLVSSSAPMQDVLELTSRIAESSSTVLIGGETGTGKELVARRIHLLSPVSDGPFVAVHCAALPSGLLESELFGHEKGAFTGAIARRQGRFELADGGTLFLDEVGEIGPEAQAKLLRVLQERSFERVGGTEPVRVRVRIVAATNRDLARCVREGSFREDLYYRLNVIPVHLPPLRQRREDIPLLVTHFLERYRRSMGRPTLTVSPEAMRFLSAYDWPGNVREIQNLVERLVVTVAGSVIEPSHLPPDVRAARWSSPQDRGGEPVERAFATLEENERAHIVRALERSGGVIRGEGGAAALLGVPESTLRYRIKKLGLTRKGL